MATLYFVDGYHGGIRGHMPEGCWNDILNSLKHWPQWKISLEIEPESFEYMRIHNPYAYTRLKEFVSDPSTKERVEFISGSYAQPFCWAINGESNIRQLLYGRDTLLRHFKDITIDTYAVQEPCFTSSLPQILGKLGYKRMSLKNPTAWGGYMDKMPGDMINLESADGSFLPTIPRYEWEELISCNATEASGYDYSAISKFADKCVDKGIPAPLGMCLQDLGWQSAPLVQDIDVEYTTFRAYFKKFNTLPLKNIPFHQENIHVALPWGNRILQEMLRNIRKAENRILQIEKLLALAETEQGNENFSFASCRNLLVRAWKNLMQAQHHDGYICATCGEDMKQWAFQSNSLVDRCLSSLDEICDIVMGTVAICKDSEDTIWLRVYNTVGNPCKALAQITLGLEPDVNSLHVYHVDGQEIPCQYTPLRKYAHGGIGTALLSFEADIDGIGYASYKVVTDSYTMPESPGIAHKGIQNTIEVKTKLLHAIFDLNKGGSLVRLLHYETGRDYAKETFGFSSLKGFFIDQNRFVHTVDTPVTCEILENGSLYCRLLFKGICEEMSFEHRVIIYSTSSRIDCETAVFFKENTNIGFPYTPTPEESFHGTRRSSLREDYKLSIQFPLGTSNISIKKNAPYDVYDSNLKDTTYDTWEQIKHNIINNGIDLYEEASDSGLSILCDCTNGYSLTDNTLSLTLAFGYHGGFWWGYQPAKGKYKIAYSLLPHKGDWNKGNVSFEDAKLREPLLVQCFMGKPKELSRTLFSCDNLQVETTAILKEKENYQVRLFHSGNSEGPLYYKHDLPLFKGISTDFYGNPLHKTIEDNNKTKHNIGKMEIRTLQ
ncbi:hypothetical protein LJC58_05775 [Lachnospiraceae bacterium OttesenSCG-928-D06]|nr:hypothetical protein [Lachnospiraceae bacterium OttesenSCG-928-D06]